MAFSINKDQALDIFERVAWTFVQAFIGVFGVVALGWLQQLVTALAGGTFVIPELTSLQAAAVAGVVAGVAAVVSLVKGWIASYFGNGTAATLPASVEPLQGGDLSFLSGPGH